MSRVLRVAVPSVALLLALGFAVQSQVGRSNGSTAALPPSRGTPAGIVARGRIEPRGGVVALSGPPESGSTVAIVERLFVEQGSKIAEGQVVAIVSGFELAQADHDVAEANLRVARLQRAQLQAGTGKVAEIAAQENVLAARQAQFVKAEKDWNRAYALVQKNAVSTQILDAQRAALDQVTQEIEQTRNTIKALSEVRPVDDELAAGQVAVAEANVTRAVAAMARLQIRARQSGTVLSIQTRSGEIISSDGIMRVGDLDQLIVVAEVDHGQLQAGRLGLAVTIEGPLLAEPIPARVTRIANETYRQRRPSSDVLVGRDARIVEVEVAPDRPLPPVIGAEVMVRFSAPPAS